MTQVCAFTLCQNWNNVGHIARYCRSGLVKSETQMTDVIEQFKENDTSKREETNNEVENSMVFQTIFHAQGQKISR